MLNILIVFLGFREGAKAMSKTARRCRAERGCGLIQRLAILPWPSGLRLIRTGVLLRPVLKSAAASAAGFVAAEQRAPAQ
jgi:hypothetical protein